MIPSPLRGEFIEDVFQISLPQRPYSFDFEGLGKMGAERAREGVSSTMITPTLPPPSRGRKLIYADLTKLYFKRMHPAFHAVDLRIDQRLSFGIFTAIGQQGH